MKWRKLRYRNLQLPESTIKMLKNLHNEYQLGLVTNGPSKAQWEKVKDGNILSLFPSSFHFCCQLFLSFSLIS